ncbi:DUF6912 family protein [Brevibacterium atlanticum]|uniref:DUF6912 family protein n=1 Tax=Brevibacterium atlanticum TaxID=2697563 RepID=UPI00141E8330|nr:hypothetical protein [Brevibacterium atlanticum]
MAIRCYIPTTLTALRSRLTDVRAVAPDQAGRGLRGEEAESAEFDALCIAAALAADAALEPAGKTDTALTGFGPRVVVAYDAPDASPREPLTEGFELLALAEVEMDAVASFHLDEVEIWDEAVSLARESGATAAEDHLGDSDLLWYDATELDQLLCERG